MTLNIRSAIAINKQNNYNNNNNKNNNKKKNVKTNSNIYELRKKLNWCGPKHEKDALIGLDDRLCQKQFPKLSPEINYKESQTTNQSRSSSS